VRSSIAVGSAAVVAMLAQTTVFPWVPHLPLVPDLLVVLVVYLGLRHQGLGGACGAFLIGYFLDTFSGTTLGVNAFGMTAVYAGVTVVARSLWIEGGVPAMIVVFGGALARDLIGVAVAALVAARPPMWAHVLTHGLVAALVAALVAPAIFAIVGWEKRVLGVA